jgi:hypothetical protein
VIGRRGFIGGLLALAGVGAKVAEVQAAPRMEDDLDAMVYVNTNPRHLRVVRVPWGGVYPKGFKGGWVAYQTVIRDHPIERRWTVRWESRGEGEPYQNLTLGAVYDEDGRFGFGLTTAEAVDLLIRERNLKRVHLDFYGQRMTAVLDPRVPPREMHFLSYKDVYYSKP